MSSWPGPLTPARRAAGLLVCVLGMAACEQVHQDQFMGSASLTWAAVTADVQGRTLTDLAGYRIYYGPSAKSLTQKSVLSDPHATGHVVTNLAPGTWYFAVSAYTNSGAEGPLSNIVQKKIN